MTSKETAPYGSWKSAITADSVTSKSRTLSAPRVSFQSGRTFYVETREAGGKTIVEITRDGLEDVLPAEYSATNTVYEYGGSPYAVLANDRVIFSHKDNTVHVLNPDTREVTSLTGAAHLRYSNFDANPASPWCLANEEDHAIDTPDQVRNRIVAINSRTGEVKRLLESADFYFTPCFSPDGEKLAWLEWNHPDIPFDAAKLYWADWNPDGLVENVRLISGDERNGVVEPHWGPDGSLFFGQETSNYRTLFRILPRQEEPAEIQLKDLEHAEFGEIRWYQGSHTYAALSDRHLVAAAVVFGVTKLILIDLQEGSWRSLADSTILSEIMFDGIFRATNNSFLVIGSGTTHAQTLYRINIDEPAKIEVLRLSTEESFPETIYSKPESIRFTSEGSDAREMHGFLWMPHNADYVAPEGDLPPLIMLSHGGPTAYMGSGLKTRTQYFTSRGYACFALNHAGSTGFGKRYREALFGQWGIIDSADASECAKYLVNAGRIKPEGVGITGVSAGGYNTLQSLVRHPETFSGGVCLSGVSDIQRLDESTHKLESDYMGHLVLPPSDPSDKAKILRNRSPLYNAEKIEAPLLLLHGRRDKVTPLDQAEMMADAIKKKGGEVEMIIVDDEAHGFFKPENVKLWLIEEEKWWQKTLLRS